VCPSPRLSAFNYTTEVIRESEINSGNNNNNLNSRDTGLFEVNDHHLDYNTLESTKALFFEDVITVIGYDNEQKGVKKNQQKKLKEQKKEEKGEEDNGYEEEEENGEYEEEGSEYEEEEDGNKNIKQEGIDTKPSLDDSYVVNPRALSPFKKSTLNPLVSYCLLNMNNLHTSSSSSSSNRFPILSNATSNPHSITTLAHSASASVLPVDIPNWSKICPPRFIPGLWNNAWVQLTLKDQNNPKVTPTLSYINLLSKVRLRVTSRSLTMKGLAVEQPHSQSFLPYTHFMSVCDYERTRANKMFLFLNVLSKFEKRKKILEQKLNKEREIKNANLYPTVSKRQKIKPKGETTLKQEQKQQEQQDFIQIPVPPDHKPLPHVPPHIARVQSLTPQEKEEMVKRFLVGCVNRIKFIKMKKAVRIIQKVYRMVRERRKYLRFRKAVVRIQATFKMRIQRKIYLKIRKLIVQVQVCLFKNFFYIYFFYFCFYFFFLNNFILYC
jgi:hypothetical protein